MGYIAHIRESDGKIQTVEEHLLEVKALAEQFGAKIDLKHVAGLAGLLHDMGKYTDEFKEYLLEAVANPNSPPKRGSVDHSTAGGKLLYQLLHEKIDNQFKGLLAEIVGNAIISHHAYLQDFLNEQLESPYLKRVRDKEPEEFQLATQRFFSHVMSDSDFRQYVEQAAAEVETYHKKMSLLSFETKMMFLTKFVFSALIDADRTNTRRFEENKQSEPPMDSKLLFKDYYEKLMGKIRTFAEHEDADSPINTLRRAMSDQCEHFAEKPSEVYTLSIPTGGGKTLASLRYGLKHAQIYDKKRIIYVVPYTTIIEQNAEEVRRILRDPRNILEHHSNVIDDVNEEEEYQDYEDGMLTVQQKLKLAKDNWDSPIIFTTMVQFLNVFYAKGSRNIRRLHNLSKAVIIFDEVQKVPVPCISLFNQAVNFLKDYGRSSMLLCTATQPELDYVEHKLEIKPNAEIIENLGNVIQAFQRVEVIDKATDQVFNNDELAEFVSEQLREVQSVLVILNTKAVVKALYRQLQEEHASKPIYHLSTSMCAAHRKVMLDEIREHLEKEHPVICISTQLIEAGVDVSFECVIRSLAGLDSIAQAAGRCNRHGEHKMLRQVYVIDHAEENLDRLLEIKEGKKISKKILLDLKRDASKHGGHVLSEQAMERYFQEFYTAFQPQLDYSVPKLRTKMTTLLFAKKEDNNFYSAYMSEHRSRLPLFLANSYHTAAEHFEVIENYTTSIIVPYGEGEMEGKEIIVQLNGDRSIEDFARLMRCAQQFTINVFRFELDTLIKNDALVSLLDGKVLALKDGAYDEEFGLNLDNDSQLGLDIY
ncbi:CRISPR-associated helicase Cas3' [Paenibacillaceae bacterium]|nr:CRISPR-associated helicase Cas3' [Paenibacillaceae bacterium]